MMRRERLRPKRATLNRAEARTSVSGLDIPLEQFIEKVTCVLLDELGLEKPGDVVDQLGSRWQGGRVMLHPADTSLQAKEIPLDVFFHKVVMLRNNLRVLEQKINSHEKLDRCRQGGVPAIHHALVWFVDDLQRALQKQAGSL